MCPDAAGKVFGTGGINAASSVIYNDTGITVRSLAYVKVVRVLRPGAELLKRDGARRAVFAQASREKAVRSNG